MNKQLGYSGVMYITFARLLRWNFENQCSTTLYSFIQKFPSFSIEHEDMVVLTQCIQT